MCSKLSVGYLVIYISCTGPQCIALCNVILRVRSILLNFESTRLSSNYQQKKYGLLIILPRNEAPAFSLRSASSRLLRRVMFRRSTQPAHHRSNRIANTTPKTTKSGCPTKKFTPLIFYFFLNQ